jgi:hypothetical protein
MAKSWAWSYSKYKAYDACPKRHYEVDLQKNYVEDSEQLKWGNEVHKAIQLATEGKEPLPASMADYQCWVDEMRSGVFSGDDLPPWVRHLKDPECKVVVEQQYSITKDFQPTQWFAHNTWFRGICDAARFDPTMTVGLARDYKTGQIKHDSRQLMLMAQCMFVHVPSLKRIRTEFVWLKDDCVTAESYDRNTIAREWPPLLPLVKQMEEANVTKNYPPKPCGLCARYCPVLSCQFHGKRYRAA